MLLCASDDFMMHAMTWASCVENAAANDDQTATDTYSAVERAEAVILGHLPRNAAEIIVQLEIICHDLDEGHRVDGLDVHAIRNIQSALRDEIVQDRDDELSGFLAIRGRACEPPHGSEIGDGPARSPGGRPL
ncbi:hypothetical protein [Brevundimonas sp.]|uniref:hypothetical protein n=1 Tax=Brevundimonas sp. TaxID=1871086 RepID=UPI00286B058D|nr:hypothetical protein [Brevundimonas sp.]